MKKEEQSKESKNKKKNKSAEYYSGEVYSYGTVYGISEDHQSHNSKVSEDVPVESWGWTNKTD